MKEGAHKNPNLMRWDWETGSDPILCQVWGTHRE